MSTPSCTWAGAGAGVGRTHTQDPLGLFSGASRCEPTYRTLPHPGLAQGRHLPPPPRARGTGPLQAIALRGARLQASRQLRTCATLLPRQPSPCSQDVSMGEWSDGDRRLWGLTTSVYNGAGEVAVGSWEPGAGKSKIRADAKSDGEVARARSRGCPPISMRASLPGTLDSGVIAAALGADLPVPPLPWTSFIPT